MSQPQQNTAEQVYLTTCGYGKEDEHCHFCGAKLTTILTSLFYDEKTGSPQQYAHKRCTKTKKFLWWEVYACPTNVNEM